MGNQISSEGTNIDDIQAKCNRGIGTVNKIQTILETMYFGIYYFEVGKTMIESMLLGSILNNIEVAYNLTQSEIEKVMLNNNHYDRVWCHNKHLFIQFFDGW